jgi:diguanylate cyclase (GGDEF)-like protein
MAGTPELLAHVPLLTDLTAEERERLAAGVRRERHPEGAAIVEMGSRGRSLYLLVRGSVQVVYPSGGKDFELARLGPGDFFGEMALLNDRPRSATVRALEEVDALVLDQEEFRRVVLEAPAIALRLLGALSARIRNADEQISTLGEQAMHDPLTHLLNRRAFQERMDTEMDRHLRYGATFALILLDLDNFKGINDTLGHGAGDEVLAWTGGILKEHTRAADSAFRIGGEEFAVLCPSTGAGMARRAAERLVGYVADTRPPGLPELHVTLSGGYAACPTHGATFQDVYHASDQALLRAKGGGRNQVCDPELVTREG